MKLFIFFIIALFINNSISFSQADCNIADYGCTLDDFTVNSSGGGLINDLPSGSTISNPSTNPGSAGNSGCLFSGELNPTWIIFTISTPGYFEFTLGQPGGNGFYDWALWPYYEAGQPGSIQGGDACSEITGNLLPPAACNWNASSAGYTGMVMQGNLPPGGVQGNFEHSFWAEPGDQFVLMFSNFSGLIGTSVPIYTGNDIPGNANNTQSANVTCDPSSVGSTICLGDVATININPGGIIGATFNFLTNAGDLVDPTQTGPSFDLMPSDTTTYVVEVTNGILTDTVEVTINVVPPPNPNAGLDFTVCQGTPGQLNGSVSSPDNNFTWTFVGPTGTPAPPNIVYTPNVNSLNPTIQSNYPGVYTFTLTESNGVCPDETDDVDVLFSQASLTLSSTDPVCEGATDGVITINSPDAVSYSYNNGTTWVTNNSQSGFSAGTYLVCVENSNGCTACQSISINEGPGMTITISNDTTICENGTAILNAQAQGGSAISYNWSHTAANNSPLSINPINTATYEVYAENEFGCTTETVSMVVNVLPAINGSISPSQQICPGFSTLLSSTATGGNGGPFSYNWTDNNGTHVGSTSTISVTPSQTTTYTLTITDNCESSPVVLTTAVIVSPLPEVLFSVDEPGKCVPATFTFSNDTDPSLIGESYWYFSNGTTYMNVDNFDVEFTIAGTYGLQLVIVTPEGCVDSSSINPIVTAYPQPQAIFNFNPEDVTIFTTEVSFNNFSSGNDQNEWIFDGGSPGNSTLENPVILYPEEVVENYYVELIVTSQYGCKDTAFNFVQVKPEVILYAPNSFTPDGDEHNNEWRIFISGIEQFQGFDLQIYNRWGEIIWESYDANASWDGTYRGRKVPEGTYIWKARATDSFTDAKYEFSGHITILY
jgi:gliding motility-associated-like protein